VPTLSRIDPNSRELSVTVLSFGVTHAVVWLVPLLVGLGPLGRRRPMRDPLGSAIAVPPARARAIGPAAAAAMAWSLLALARDGADRNTLFEGYIGLATWSFAILVQRLDTLAEDRYRWVRRGVLAAVTSMALYPIAQLALLDRIGNQTLATSKEVVQLSHMAALIDRLPKPILVEHGLFAQPWHSTAGRYPAIVVDVYWYNIAWKAGLMDQSGGVRSLVLKRQFPCLLAQGRVALGLASAAEEAGYVRLELPEAVRSLGFTLYVLPSAADEARAATGPRRRGGVAGAISPGPRRPAANRS
jgi:hypothetical protein